MKSLFILGVVLSLTLSFSSASAQNWKSVGPPIGAMQFWAGKSGLLLAYPSLGTTLYRSTNSGKVWQPISVTSEPAAIFQVAATDKHIFAATESGVYISSDNAVTWKKTSDFVYAN